METWIALLRGINVGGHRKLPMQRLVAILEGLGCRDVRTYIQSGNAIFRTDAARDLDVPAAIEAEMGFRADALLLRSTVFRAVVTANPFPEAVEDPKSLHVFFLAGPPAPDAEERMVTAKSETERFALTSQVLYLHTPAYLAGSRLAERAERLLGVGATARNWNTVTRILDLAARVEGGARSS